MALKLVSLFAMCILVLVLGQQPQGEPHEGHGGPHQNQGRVRRETVDYQVETSTFPPEANWTACDITVNPILSCHDCTTRMICKPVGGFLRPCNNPMKPYCNGGLCLATPSTDCVGGV